MQEQIDDPLNPVLSYNLGVAALEKKDFARANNCFSLATDLYERDDAGMVPAYFCWADTAAQQLLGVLQKEKELSQAAVEEGLRHAVDASNRYGNVLVFDEHHQQAKERKEVVDKIRAFLEQRKKEKEEEKKQQDQQKQDKQNQDKQKNQNNGQSQGQDQQQNDSSDQQQRDAGKNGQKGTKDQKREQSPEQQQKDEQDQSDGGKQQQEQPQEAEGNDAGQDQQQPQDEQKQGQGDQNQQGGEQQEQKDGGDAGGESGDDTEQEQQAAQAMAAQEHEQGEDGEQAGQQESAAVAAQYDANAEMAKRRALVLLDKLQQKESALQKEQLLKKSAQQGAEAGRYNQW